jgi:hypothetical protein
VAYFADAYVSSGPVVKSLEKRIEELEVKVGQHLLENSMREM